MPDKKPRVVFVSITFDPEPGTMFGLTLAKALREKGYECTVLTAIPWYPAGKYYPGYKAKLWQWEVMDGIRVLRVPLKPSHDGSGIRRIVTYFSFMFSATLFGVPRVGPADVVFYFDNQPTTGMVCWLLRVFKRARAVQHVADLWPDTVIDANMLPKKIAGPVGKMLDRWMKFLYRRQSQMSVISRTFKERLIARGLDGNRIEVIYNWAIESEFFPLPTNRELRAEYGVDDKVVILYAGNIGPMQALDTLVDAAVILKDDPRLEILVFGGGPSEPGLQRRSEELGLKNLRFLGQLPRTEMNRINSVADGLLVHLQGSELMHATIPGKTQVALACGRPILLGVKGDAAELLEGSGSAIIFEPQNAESMATAFRQFADMTAEERKEMGECGRRLYEESFQLAVGAAKVDRMFQRALTEKGTVL